MNNIIELLIVEDDDDQYDTYSDTAEEFDNIGQVKFSLTRKKRASDAIQALLSTDFDAAIVDLNLDKTNSDEASGNQILENIVGSHRFPVFVVSGNLGKLDNEISCKTSFFLTCYDRNKSNDEIFKEIVDIWRTGITKILGGRGLIETKLNDIFWKHLSNDMDVWIKSSQNAEKALLRYTVSHLAEYLDQPSGDNDYYYCEAEFYIKPPIRETIATGDIVENENSEKLIVLSPACDIAVRGVGEEVIPIINAQRIILAKLIEVNRENFIVRDIIKVSSNSNDRKKAIERIIQGQQDKYIFLPEYKELQASVIDLQNIYTIEFNDFREKYNRLATVASPFLKDIQSRFSSYFGRQGQPDLNKKEMVNKHKSRLAPDD